MRARTISVLLSALGAGMCTLALSTSSAEASWADGQCADVAGKHCYAEAIWKPEATAGVLNTWSYIDTTEMYVPEPEQNFVTNEQWTSWKNLFDWVEAGQLAGRESNPETIRSFYAVFNNSEYEEVIGPPTSFDARNLYQFYSDVPGEVEQMPGEDWCIKIGGPVYPVSQEGTVRCYRGLHGPSTELNLGAEAATESEPTGTGTVEGFAAAGRNELWQEVANERNHAIRYHKLIKVNGERVGEATCVSRLARRDYGSLRFGVGAGCPETLDEPREAAPPSRSIGVSSVAAIAEDEAARDGDDHAGGLTVAEVTLGGALEAMRPGSMASALMSAGPAEAADLGSGADLVELHGSFTLEDAPVPRGAAAPTGTVLRLLVNAKTGEIEGRSLR